MKKPYEVPSSYKGKVSLVKDSIGKKRLGGIGAEEFRVLEVDGSPVSERPYTYVYGGGMALNMKESSRKVTSGKHLITLNGGHVYAADGAALIDSMKGGGKSVSGDVYVNLKPNKNYVVKGDLDSKTKSVWLEEEASGKVVGNKIYK